MSATAARARRAPSAVARPARRSCARPRGSSAPSISSEKAGFPMTDLKRDADRPMPDVVGILPLRGTVLFPQAVVPLGAGRASSVRLIEEALQGGRLVGAVTQKDPADDAPGADGLHSIGTLPVIHTALKQELLETVNVRERLTKLAAALGKEAEVLELGSKIQSEIQSEMTRTQRDYYLREQMKAIRKELGEGDERTQEIDALRAKIDAAGMSDEAKAEALRELDRLAKMPPAAAEYTVVRTYIDWLVAMPWQQETTDAVDIAPARVILDEDHEGLEKVKDRILEYLAGEKIRPSGKDPNLCFVGHPGVDKTSLGKSIARDRKSTRLNSSHR